MLCIDFDAQSFHISKDNGIPEILGITVNKGEKQLEINYQELYFDVDNDGLIHNSIKGMTSNEINAIKNADEIVVSLSHGSQNIPNFNASIDGVDLSEKVYFEDVEDYTSTKTDKNDLIIRLFPESENSIGQMEEYEETLALLRTPGGRKQIEEYLKSQENSHSHRNKSRAERDIMYKVALQNEMGSYQNEGKELE